MQMIIKNNRCMAIFSYYGMYCCFSWHCIIYPISLQIKSQ